ncbi:MAG: MFS transporter [Proteobacteria bacterium]|nr:MFS transporter [Pseudomonadota bacterium]
MFNKNIHSSGNSTEAATADAPTQSAPVKKGEIFSWAMFDFANSSYTTVVITAVFSAFFVENIVPKESTARDSYWTFAMSASTLVALILSPLAGAICDLSGRKKLYLAYTTVICALATGMLSFVGQGDIALAIALITVSNAAFMLSETFCGSFLPDLSTRENMGLISGIGWGLGYFGGLASLALVMAVIGDTKNADGAVIVSRHQTAMIVTGAFFLIAALPTLLFVKNRSRPKAGYENASTLDLLKAGVSRFRQTFQTAKQHKTLFRFLLAFMVYMAGLDAVVKFVGIYARSELKFELSDITKMFLILQLSAAAGAVGFGFLESKLGAKKTVMATLVWWIIGILAIYFIQPAASLTGYDPKTLFFGISLIAGSGIGATQSSSRAVVGLLAPASHSAEIFGFWGFFSRLGALLGALFGILSDAAGRQNALLLIVAFFVVGGIMLSPLKIDEETQANRNPS